MKRLLGVLMLACLPLGGMQAEEKQVDEISDAEMALGYYRPLAEEGSPYAQLTLGEIFMEGRGVEQDLVRAYAWFYVSLYQGVDEAEGVMKEVYSKLTDPQKQQAEALAEEFVKAYAY